MRSDLQDRARLKAKPLFRAMPHDMVSLYDDNYDGRLTTTMMAGQGFPFGKL